MQTKQAHPDMMSRITIFEE